MKKFIKKNRLYVAAMIIVSILSSASLVSLSLVLQYAIDNTIAGKMDRSIIIVIGFIITFGIIYWIRRAGGVKLNQTIMEDVRFDFVVNILRKSKLEFDSHKEADYISVLTNDVKKIEEGYFENIFSIIESSAQLLFGIGIMTHYSWVFTIVMLGMTAVMLVVPSYFSKKMQGVTKEVSMSQENFTRGLTEVIRGYDVIKAFNEDAHRVNKFKEKNKDLSTFLKKFGYTKEANDEVSVLLSFSMQLVICVLAGWFIYENKLSYGSMLGVIQVSGSITNPLFTLFNLIPTIKSFTPLIAKIEDYKGNTSSNNEVSPLALNQWKEISYDNINFSYPGTHKKVLNDVSLKIEKGKKYLIIGESGGGKSTLINTLCGIYPSASCTIKIDGQEKNAYAQLIGEHAAMISQNVFLFQESIEENITFGKLDKEKLSNVINTAKLTDMVLEKGLDFEVGENGSQLSGGQKQRVAIARALYAQRDILVLDEGFSALDPASALKIEKDLLKDKNITVLSISHHFSNESIKFYDEILEVKDGKIIRYTSLKEYQQHKSA